MCVQDQVVWVLIFSPRVKWVNIGWVGSSYTIIRNLLCLQGILIQPCNMIARNVWFVLLSTPWHPRKWEELILDCLERKCHTRNDRLSFEMRERSRNCRFGLEMLSISTYINNQHYSRLAEPIFDKVVRVQQAGASFESSVMIAMSTQQTQSAFSGQMTWKVYFLGLWSFDIGAYVRPCWHRSSHG